jgi:hypothetical protein
VPPPTLPGGPEIVCRIPIMDHLHPVATVRNLTDGPFALDQVMCFKLDGAEAFSPSLLHEAHERAAHIFMQIKAAVPCAVLIPSGEVQEFTFLRGEVTLNNLDYIVSIRVVVIDACCDCVITLFSLFHGFLHIAAKAFRRCKNKLNICKPLLVSKHCLPVLGIGFMVQENQPSKVPVGLVLNGRKAKTVKQLKSVFHPLGGSEGTGVSEFLPVGEIYIKFSD